MRSFKDYDAPTGGQNQDEKKDDTPLSAAELTQKMVSAWSGKSSGDMLAYILGEAERSKKSGALTNEEIDEFYSQFSPMLDAFQKRALGAVVERLKRI